MKVVKRLYYFILKVRGYLRYYFYKMFIPKNGISSGDGRSSKIIVTMTSFTPRLKTVDVCIKTLLNQTKKPDSIILYLGNDVKESDVPLKLKMLQKYGLTIVTDCEDIRPHKKYFYAMQEFSDDIIITVDDDVLYERDLIKSLYEAHMKYPDAVICRRARRITRDDLGELLPYSKWPVVKCPSLTPSMEYISTGVGGALYPPYAVSYRAFDIDSIKKYCLNADDIWLKANEVLNGTLTYCIKTRFINPFQIPNTAESSLRRTNIVQNQNDEFIMNVQELFDIKIDGRV